MTEKMFPIPLRPMLQRCDSFVDKNGNISSTTIVVVATRLVHTGDAWLIRWSCSRGEKCRNEGCRYSHASAQNRERINREY